MGEQRPAPEDVRDEVGEAIMALPVGTVVVVGNRWPSGNLNGSLYLRTDRGLRYIGPRRNNNDERTLWDALPIKNPDFDVVAVPLDQIERLRTVIHDAERELVGSHYTTDGHLCITCGAADGSWPCCARMVAHDLAVALDGSPDA